MDWQFKLLGKPEIWYQQTRIEVFNTQKTQALLFYLIAEVGNHNRNDLARFFWDDFNLISSQNNLRTTLYHLKQDFEPCLEIERQYVAFSLPEGAYLDLALVDVVSPAADTRALSAAADAYRGDFLEGYSTTIPNFEAWKEDKQTHYRKLIIKYLLQLAERFEKDYQSQHGLEAARHILEIDPINEAAILLHMRLLARMGLYERAIQSYQNYQNTLKELPRVQPSPRVKEYYANLKIPHLTQVRSSLPFIETKFFGRKAEIDQLTSWLDDPSLHWINLVGHSGIGKSQLAIFAAESVVSNFKDGVRYLDLRGFNAGEEEVNIENACKLALSIMHIRIVLGKSYSTQLCEALTLRETLIILDNFESYDWWQKFVTETLLSSSTIKLLGVSRQPVDFPDGVTLNLEGLTYPQLEELPSNFDTGFINRFTSLQMFEDRARGVLPGFKIDQSNYRQISIMCNLVQGLPIGIEYITNLLPKSSIDKVLAALLGDTSHDPILATETEIPKKLKKVLDYIWSNLTPEIKEMTLACSLFKGTFSPADFTAVTTESSNQLITLGEEALLYIVTKERFSLHDLIRAYLDKKGYKPVEPIQLNYSEYYLNELIKLDKGAQSSPYPIEAIRSQFADLRHAWELALEHESFDLLCQACYPLASAYEQLGLAETAISHFVDSAEVLDGLAEPTNPAQLAQGRILLEAARLALKSDQAPFARDMADKAAEIARLLNDSSLLARSYQYLSVINNQEAQTKTAIKNAKDGVTQAVTSGDEQLLVTGMISLGQVYLANHQYSKAMAAFQTANDEKLVGNDFRTRLVAIKGIFNCLKAKGRFNQALAINEKAQQINEVLKDKFTDAYLALSCGEISKFLGQFEAADLHISQASATFSLNDFFSWQALCLANLGILHYWTGEYTEAFANIVAAEELAREKRLSKLPEILTIKSRIMLARGQKEAAQDILKSLSLDKSTDSNSKNSMMSIIAANIDLALAEGEHKTAQKLAARILPEINQLDYNNIDDPFAVYLSLYHTLKDHDPPSALEVLLHARQTFTRLHNNLPSDVTIKSILKLPHRRELAKIIQEHLDNPDLN